MLMVMTMKYIRVLASIHFRMSEGRSGHASTHRVLLRERQARQKHGTHVHQVHQVHEAHVLAEDATGVATQEHNKHNNLEHSFVPVVSSQLSFSSSRRFYALVAAFSGQKKPWSQSCYLSPPHPPRYMPTFTSRVQATTTTTVRARRQLGLRKQEDEHERKNDYEYAYHTQSYTLKYYIILVQAYDTIERLLRRKQG